MNNIKEKLDKITSAEENLKDLYSLFYSIDDNSLPIIRFYIEKDSFVIRQRINPIGKELTHVSQLRYPPSDCCYEYGRANLPGHPMFYCCSFATDIDAPEPRYTSLLETSKFVWDKSSKGVERSTCTRWDVVEKLNLLALPFSSNYERTFFDIVQIQNEWNVEKQKVDINQDALNLINYMSDEIAKDVDNPLDYFKIANFIYYVLHINTKTKDSDGIIYPSVAAGGEGFNIVLKPEAVDKKLRFYGASLCYLIKDKMKAELHVVNHAIGCSDDGTLKYVPQEDFNIRICDGYDFVN